ncbi:hypothetical protein KA005_08655, partial [bacterium]|nr:hypothetical protein [bacterium]
WEKDETRLELVDYAENPRIATRLEGIPESVWGGKNVMIIAYMEADGCVATNLRVASCIDEKGDNLIDIEKTKQAVSFCDDAKFYWFGKTPAIKRGVRYSCPVTAAGGGGTGKAYVSITAEPERGVEISTSTQKILVPGQTMEVEVSLRNTGYSARDLRIFAILDDEIKEGALSLQSGGTDDIKFEFTAPQIPGEYELQVFSSSGDLKGEMIDVISNRQLKITEISIPKALELGSVVLINVSVYNFGEESAASVKLQAGKFTDTKNIMIDTEGVGAVSFDFTADSEGITSVIISILDGDSYQDSWTGNINVFKEPSIKDSIAKTLEDFIMWLLDSIRSIFSF